MSRKTARDGEISCVVALRVTKLPPLERLILRRCIGELEAERDRCRDCGRTPLTGEQVHLYEGRRPGIVCELCRALRHEVPVASETVRHCEHELAVRVPARAA